MSSGTRAVLKAAKAHIVPAIERFGFKRYRSTNSFVRRIGAIYHFISFNGSRWGGSFYVYVTAWVPEITGMRDDPKSTFDDGRSVVAIGGQLSRRSIGDGGWSWEYGDEQQLTETLEEVRKLLEGIAIPWFACMTTREQLARGLGPNQGDETKQALLAGSVADFEFEIPDTGKSAAYPWKPGELRSINENSWLSESDDDDFLQSGGNILVEHMAGLGFTLQRAPVLRFLRKEGDYSWVVTFESASDGVHANVRVYTWSRDVAIALYGRCNSEIKSGHYWQVNGGFLGADGIDQGELAWLVAGEAEIKKTMPKLSNAIDKWAMPWFQGVSTHEAFRESLLPNQLPTQRFTNLARRLDKKIDAQRLES